MRLKLIWFVSFFVIFALSTPYLSQSISQDSKVLTSGGNISYIHSTATLKFAAGFEELASVPKKPFYVKNTATGLQVLLKWSWGGDSDSTYNYGWVETSQENRGVTAHSGIKSIGMQTASTKRATLLIDTAELKSVGIENQFYLREWFYLPSDWDSQTSSWYSMFQPTCQYHDSGSGYADVPYYAFSILDGSSHNGIVTYQLAYRSAGGVKSYPARVYNQVLPRGQWFKFEWFQVMSNDPSVARVITWINGQKLWDVTGHQTLTTGTNGDHYYIQFSKIYHGSTSELYEQWVDDVEIWDGIPT